MRPILVLLSLAAGLIAAQDFNTVAACGQQCFTNMKGTIAGCAADNQKCHCDAPQYRNGLRDCVAQACAPPDVPLVQTSLTAYIDSVCKAAEGGAPAASSAAPAATATPTPAPAPASSSAPPPPSATPAASSSSSPAAAATSTTATPATSAAAPATTSTGSSTATGAGAAASSSSSSSAASTSTGAAAAGATTKPKPDSLSSGTVAGIAIGGVAVGLGLIGVLVCVLLHRRNKSRGADPGSNISLNISQPMPGSGRSYAGDHHHEKYEVGNSSLDDFKSRRYEDMLPRQTPRTMV